jgi:hypothetical protein
MAAMTVQLKSKQATWSNLARRSGSYMCRAWFLYLVYACEEQFVRIAIVDGSNLTAVVYSVLSRIVARLRRRCRNTIHFVNENATNKEEETERYMHNYRKPTASHRPLHPCFPSAYPSQPWCTRHSRLHQPCPCRLPAKKDSSTWCRNWPALCLVPWPPCPPSP